MTIWLLLKWIEVAIAPVWFSAVPESEINKSIEASSLIELQCEIPGPASQIYQCEDGIKLLPKLEKNMESEGNKTTLVRKLASSSYSEVYSCKTDDDDDDSDFNSIYVEVKGDMLSFSWQDVVTVVFSTFIISNM